MRIAVDGRHLLAGRGVARATRSLLAQLAGELPGAEIVAVVPGRAPVADRPRGVRLARVPLPSRAVHGAAVVAGRPRVDRLAGGADVVWLPAPAPVAVSRRVPVVLTIHDRSWELRPSDFTAYERAWHRMARPRALARRAARVVTASAWVRDDLAAAWGLPAERMALVPLGAGLPPADTAPAVAGGAGGAGLPPADTAPAVAGGAGGRPYLLAVGALEPRKAPAVLARAFALARDRGLDADLLVAGGGRLAGALDGADGVRLLGAVDDRELDALYRGALALVHPALLEGFGLTPLEAAARGVPTAGSDLPPLRETLGDAALLVAPGDPEALAAALLQLAGDAALRRRLGAAARERAGRYTWEAAGRALAAVLREAAACA